MPRSKRQKRSRRSWTQEQKDQLLGRRLFLQKVFTTQDKSDHKMRKAWEELKAELLPAWIKEQPFTRPYAWWVFSSPERRRRLNGQHPFDNPERKKHIEKILRNYPDAKNDYHKLYFGKPQVSCMKDDFDARYESERDYLERLDLLTESEETVLSEA